MKIHQQSTPVQWWEDAVIYQIYPRSFASSSGKIGDLRGITQRLGYVAELGVDAVWLSPFYCSPQKDGGYDVSDYRRVDPLFGSNDDVATMIAQAHDYGLKVIVDLVPNHTSDEHIWSRAALAGDHAARARYYFRDSDGCPPNDWISIFGGHAWTQVCQRADAPGSPWEHDTSWYLHLFDSSQPDLNWDHSDVLNEFDDVLRFWLRLGVDGFRVDVAHGLAKDPELPNWQYHWDMVAGGSEVPDNVPPPPMWNRPEVHDIYRRWRAVLDEFGPDRMLVAEAWVDGEENLATYVRSDEMSQAFNFAFLMAPFTASDLRETVRSSLRAMDSVGAPTTWVLSNHDIVRATSRLGLSSTGKGPNGIRSWEEQPDAKLGRKRALAAHLLQAALPGSSYIYQGEELSLPEHTSLPDDVREDPAFFRTEGREAGRDGQRVPMPWSSTEPAFGFSATGESWLPQPAEWAEIAVDVQEQHADSSLNHFKRMLDLRKVLKMGSAALSDAEPTANHLHYVSSRDDRADVHVMLAFDTPVLLPEDANLLIATCEITDGVLPANSAVWFERD